MTEKVRLMVNGQEIEVNAGPDTPLLYVLRNHLGLVGARFGCGLGLCGSCDVILEDRVVHSCDTPLWSVAGKNVRTLEGLSSAGEPSPLQRAFIEEQAAQCGYCVAGIIMNATALLERDPNPDEAEVRAALDGNLCRCGAHNRMVRAVLRVCATTSAAETTR
ncbi:MAG TPA: (2Fe-2S)-binding protein [Pseudonocardia sp.]|uniref:(2Fe-2S)-binding protein n=1 Tax=Pseudonocardia sp. TaxID=60912 RepID=UPI002C97DFD7|nr:(2Fe-2S)-binding protein [Pseudonocardia sp.]HTF50210.1 (2Fe-2S)-binding protein [Pseudonocardia sp.]